MCLSVSVLAKRIFQIHKLALQKNEILCAAIAFFRHISLASGFGSVRGSRFEVSSISRSLNALALFALLLLALHCCSFFAVAKTKVKQKYL